MTRAQIAMAMRGRLPRGLGRLGQTDNLPDFNSRTWSDYQKLMASQLAEVSSQATPYWNPAITLFLPPADSKPFIVTPTIFPGYPAPGAGQVTIISYTAPEGSIAVINKLAIVHQGANPPDGTGFVIWIVTVNNAGVKGLNNLTSQVGTYAAPNDEEILLIEGDVAQVTVQVTAGSPVQTGTTAARFHGWTYPISEAINIGQEQ